MHYGRSRKIFLPLKQISKYKNLVTYGVGIINFDTLETEVTSIQISHQPDVKIFQFIILMFIYISTCFGRFPAHHQKLNDCSGSLWFYLFS
jgi:hypothetical protein